MTRNIRRWLCALAWILVGGPAMAGNIFVPPSGDTSGATDPNRIEAAWHAAGPDDLVVLSDGDPTTVDHYYVNRVMVADVDHASLVGESEKNTILEAVHNDNPQAWVVNSDYIPECPEGAPAWAPCSRNHLPQDLVWGTPLEGKRLKDWTMRNVTLRLSDPIPPLDPDDPRNGIPRCANLSNDQLCARGFQAMEFLGGNGDYEFSHVTVEVSPGTTAQVSGPIVMWGTIAGWLDGTGNLTMKDCTFKNAWWGPVMQQSVGGVVTLANLTTIDVGNPVDFEFMFNDENTVTDSTFEYTGSRGFPARGWDGPAIQLLNTWNADVKDNQIQAPAGDLRTGVYLLGYEFGPDEFGSDEFVSIEDNVFKDVIDTPPSPETGLPIGAIYAPCSGGTAGCSPGSAHITIRDNQYDNDAFAIQLFANDSTVKEQGLTADQVYVEGTNNTVRLGK